MAHHLRFTNRQLAQVKRLHAELLVKIEKAGVRVEKRRLPKNAVGVAYYDATGPLIILGRGREEWSCMPAVVEKLFTLAHEFGHHLSHENHKRVGRCLNYDHAPDMLFEESRAWNEAWRTLHKMKMRTHGLWEAFHISWGISFITNVGDFQAHWWLKERLERLKIRCPKCSSRALRVLGADSFKSCAIQCRRCGAHTKPSASMDALDRRITRKRFRNLCPCREKAAHS